MRKKKFVCGIALCLALSVAGCGKDSKEQQAANYYQNQLGMDKEDAQDLAHELYGDNDEVGSPYEEAPGNTEVKPLPELLNSEWYEDKVQIYDMIFSNDESMTEADIRAAAAASAYDVELPEDFDENGDIVLRNMYVNGECAAQFWKHKRGSGYDQLEKDALKYGLLDDGEYYWIGYGSAYMENNWYDKGTEFADLGTRDDVLSYLAANGFVEIEEKQAIYLNSQNRNRINEKITPDKIPAGLEDIADTPHYFAKGAQSITLYRIHKLSETDQEIEYGYFGRCSGAHLNRVNFVTFTFNTDGTVASMNYLTQKSIVYGKEL